MSCQYDGRSRGAPAQPRVVTGERLVSSGGIQFLNGGNVAGGPASGQLITYQFPKNGRYLVLCIKRVHFLNDWMFGFVNVTGEDEDDQRP